MHAFHARRVRERALGRLSGRRQLHAIPPVRAVRVSARGARRAAHIDADRYRPVRPDASRLARGTDRRPELEPAAHDQDLAPVKLEHTFDDDVVAEDTDVGISPDVGL